MLKISSRKRKEYNHETEKVSEETPSKKKKVDSAISQMLAASLVEKEGQPSPKIVKNYCQTPASSKRKPKSKDRTSTVPKTRNLIEIFETIRAKNKETLEKLPIPSQSSNQAKSPKIEAKIRLFDNPPQLNLPSSTKLRQDGPETITQVKPLQAKFPPKKPLPKITPKNKKTRNNPRLTPIISNYFKMEDRTETTDARKGEKNSKSS